MGGVIFHPRTPAWSGSVQAAEEQPLGETPLLPPVSARCGSSAAPGRRHGEASAARHSRRGLMWSRRSLRRCPGHSGLPTALTEVEAAGVLGGFQLARQLSAKWREGGTCRTGVHSIYVLALIVIYMMSVLIGSNTY